MPREHLLKIGVSGIRGVVGPFLTPQLTRAFAQAFGTYVGPRRVVVGRDTRASGPMLQHAVHCGLLAAGCEVTDVGVLPTPTIQFYTARCGARGGLAITASHNPPEYNALKMFKAAGLFFNHYERSELLDIYHQSAFREATNAEMRGVTRDADAPVRLHIEQVLAQVDAERIRARRFQVALDAVNGAGAVMTPHFLQHALGCELQAISIDPGKPFPRVGTAFRDRWKWPAARIPRHAAGNGESSRRPLRSPRRAPPEIAGRGFAPRPPGRAPARCAAVPARPRRASRPASRRWSLPGMRSDDRYRAVRCARND